jgi:hypothetical protein
MNAVYFTVGTPCFSVEVNRFAFLHQVIHVLLERIHVVRLPTVQRLQASLNARVPRDTQGTQVSCARVRTAV